MFLILLGYLYLFIHRPFEIWEALDPLHIERLYFAFMFVAWAALSRKRLLDRPQIAVLVMAAATCVSWILSPWADRGEIQVKNYLLATGFAIMLGSSLKGERQLRISISVLMGVTLLYMMHSLWEYKNGKHTFRMGIARLVGVDLSLGDPNSFAGSIVYCLPFARYLWQVWGQGWRRWAIAFYVGVSALCILLTGSRGSLLGMIVWGLLTVGLGRKKLVWLVGMMCLAPAMYMALPASLQNRFETIVNPDAGPKNAQESGQGRIDGLINGVKIWSAYPLTGCGPGAWRMASGSLIESHSLPGQTIGELGTMGVAAFGFMMFSIFAGCRKVKRLLPAGLSAESDSLRALAQAISVSAVLLLFLGLFGHNLYRYNYVIYCALIGVALEAARAEASVPVWDDEPVYADEEEPAWVSLT